jgi:uncharacterized membrane protein YczE
MKELFKKILIMNIGQFLYALGITMTINANQGLSPWSVFHQGVGLKLGITIGQATILVGLIIMVINILFKEKIGWSTIANMALVGLYIDFLMFNKLVPVFNSTYFSYIMMFLGMFLVGLSTAIYLGVGWGSGPRDGIVSVIAKRTPLNVKTVRSGIESIALIIGFSLGGTVGMGTAVMALTVGFFVNLAFRLAKFDITKIEHSFIDDIILKAMNKNISVKDINIYYNPIFLDTFMGK